MVKIIISEVVSGYLSVDVDYNLRRVMRARPKYTQHAIHNIINTAVPAVDAKLSFASRLT